MNRPVIFGDNLFDPTLYPLHTISALEEPVGHEAATVANGRRSILNYATATTANAAWWARAAFDRVRSFNMWALDRGHNLAGKTVQGQISDIGDNVDANWTAVWNFVLPSNPGTGSLDDAYGVVTEERAWLIRHPTRTANYVRLYVPAMGVGLRPQVVGLWCGLSYSPTVLRRPHSPDNDYMLVEESVSTTAWRGRGRAAFPRQGAIRLKMGDWFEYELARYHLQFVFGRGHPTWIVHDEDQADRAVLAERPAGGELGLVRDAGSNWIYPTGSVSWVEREPAVAA